MVYTDIHVHVVGTANSINRALQSLPLREETDRGEVIESWRELCALDTDLNKPEHWRGIAWISH